MEDATPSGVFGASDEVIARSLGSDEIVQRRGGGPMRLSGIDALTWSLATTGADVDFLVRSTCEVAGLTVDEARRAAWASIERLRAAGVIWVVPAEPTPATTESHLTYVAAFGLPNAPSLSSRARGEVVSEALVHQCIRGRLGPFLVEAAATGEIRLEEGSAELLRRSMEERTALLLALEWHLLDLLDALRRRGVVALVVKGPATGRLDYPSPWLRDFGDLDLVVHRSDIPAALEALAGLGVRHIIPALRPGVEGLLGKGATLRHPAGFEVDLHHTLAPGFLGLRIPSEVWFEDPDSFTLGGSTVGAMGQAQRFVHACLHLIVGGAYVSEHTVRDMAQIASNVPCGSPVHVAAQRLLDRIGMAGLDTLALRAVHERWGWAPVTWLPVVHRREDVEEDGGFVSELDSVLRRWEREQRDFSVTAREVVRSDIPLRDKGRVVAAVVWPSRAHLRARSLSRTGWLWEGLRRRSAGARVDGSPRRRCES